MNSLWSRVAIPLLFVVMLLMGFKHPVLHTFLAVLWVSFLTFAAVFSPGPEE